MSNKTFRFIREAEQELDDAAAYYNKQLKGLEKEFIADIQKCVEDVISFPEAWAPFYENVRRHSAARFPFRICYYVTATEVVGLAVEHTARRPLYWIDRLNG